MPLLASTDVNVPKRAGVDADIRIAGSHAQARPLLDAGTPCVRAGRGCSRRRSLGAHIRHSRR